ncbi:MAG: YciI family protein [Pseudohaliea sp.]
MYYAIIAEDAPESLAVRRAARPAHLKRIQALVDAGRVLLAGPHPALDTREPGEAGFSGSLIVAEFDSLADAEAWAAGDPYTEAGVFAAVTVKPFLPVLP